MIVGCVKELKKHEYRVGLTPDNVKEYLSHGHQVMVEAGAGCGSGFSDQEYQTAGATIVADGKAVWQQAEMVVKVKEPMPEEIPFLRRGQIVYAYFHLASDRQLTEKILASGIKAVAYETVTDSKNRLPLLTPMSEVAGRLSIQLGAHYLLKPMGGRGVLLSGIPGTRKAKIVILGGGVVGINACKMAIGMGADVTVMDRNLDRLRYFDDVFGARISVIHSSAASVEKELSDADLVIGAVLIPGGKAPKLIRKAYLKNMQPGSVIIDVAIDQGGCCETSRPTYHDEPTFVVDGVIHYCVTNMPGAMPRTSTLGLTNATLMPGLMIADLGLEAAVKADPYLLPGINAYEGKLTHQKIAEAFDMPYVPALSCF